MSDRPIIGVTTSRRRSRPMWWFNKLALWIAGARPVRLTPDDDPIRVGRYDAFILGGGDDIGADLYQGDLTLNIRVDPERDALEQQILAQAAQRRIPILGVCRGAQMLNVFYGGTLHQDTYAHHNARRRRTVLPRKTVTIERGSKLGRLIRSDRIRVNSLHRQSVDRLGAGLEAVGRDDYGIVQAIENEERDFLIGVQWHPEFLFWLPRHARLFRALVRAAARYRSAKQ